MVRMRHHILLVLGSTMLAVGLVLGLSSRTYNGRWLLALLLIGAGGLVLREWNWRRLRRQSAPRSVKAQHHEP